METGWLILRGFLWMISFGGLCLGARLLLRMNRFIAPFFVSSAVIVLLMLAGMTGLSFALPAMFILLYAAGFVGAACAVYACVKKRFEIDLRLCGLFVLFVAFLVWRFYPSKLNKGDDLSHWGLMARTLLRYNRFPNGSMRFIGFQSYPVGTASFIYYFCRSLENTEGLQIVAQNFLMGTAFLPLFALVEGKHRRSLYALSGLLFFALFFYFRPRDSLQVDVLLAFYGIGIAGVITYYSDDLGRAVFAATPGLIAVCYIKNSGMFFIAAALLVIWYRCGKRASGKELRRSVLAVIALPLTAYGLWLLYIRAAYPAALDSKHAVSIASYAKELSNKDAGTVLLILTKMAKRVFLSVGVREMLTAAYLLAANGLIALTCCNTKRWRACLREFCVNLIPYFLWCAALAGMYIVSMPVKEAVRLASYERYIETGMLYLLGLNTISLLLELRREDALAGVGYRLMEIGSGFCAAAYLIAAAVGITVPDRLFQNHSEYTEQRRLVRTAVSEFDLNRDGRYLFFSKDDPSYETGIVCFATIKYEIEKGESIYMICEEVPGKDYRYGTWFDVYYGADIESFLRENIGNVDAIVLLEYSPEFEATLERFYQTCPNDVPVCRVYTEEENADRN